MVVRIGVGIWSLPRLNKLLSDMNVETLGLMNCVVTATDLFLLPL